MPYWLTADRFSSIIERIALHRANGREIEVTFDDGNKSDLEIAAPILAGKGIRAGFFILTGRLGHDEYLSANDVRELAATGAEIGLHGRDHVDWRGLAPQQLHAETVSARSCLANLVSMPIRTVSIPFGAYNRKVLAHLKAQGFTAVYTSDRGPARPNGWVQPRNTLRSDMTNSEIEDIIMDLSRFCTAPSARLSHFPFEGDRAFPAQC